MSGNIEEKRKEINILRFFGLRQPGNPTKVHIAEFSNGNISVQLHTKRDKMEPLITAFLLTPKTFALLSDAMFQAAHNQNVWTAVGDPKYEVSESVEVAE